MPDVLYLGYRIVFDIEEIPRTGFWKGKAAVVKPMGTSGAETFHQILSTTYFRSEKAANDFILAEAKRWIDAECRRSS